KVHENSGEEKLRRNPRLVWLIGVTAIMVMLILGISQRDHIRGALFTNQTAQSELSESTPLIPSGNSTSPSSPQSNNQDQSIVTKTESPPSQTPENQSSTQNIGGGSGQIAYASNYEDSVMQLWVMSVDGSNKQKITNLSDGACQPDWSPDGNKIVFISPCNAKKDTYDGARIFILDTTQSNLIIPADIPIDPSGDFDPIWSPDGQKIAFSSFRPGNHPISKERMIHIYIFDLINNSLTEITDTRWRDRHPAWSNDSSRIAFSRKIAYNEIWILEIDSLESFQFASRGNVNLLYPYWGLNDEYIFYTNQNISSGSLPYFLSKKSDETLGSTEFRIPPSGQQTFSPSVDSVVSPDGQWFVFESWPDGVNHDIYIATTNGAKLTQLTSEKSFEFSPAWRP
ncbi:MAG TPA: hypothetical protein VK856_06795, partial [Anaerolineaceae bacterium]|nr:hypothetical protein [Anaerolineaceae bacterium]